MMKQKTFLRAIYRFFSLVLLLSLLLTSFKLDPTSPVLAQEASTATAGKSVAPVRIGQAPKPIESQFIVHFDSHATETEKRGFVRVQGGSVVQRIDALDILVIRIPGQANGILSSHSPHVKNIEQDYYIDILDETLTPNDPRYAEQWALPAIEAPTAWAQLPADALKVTVAVIDSGICASHPDLAGRAVEGWDFLENDATPQDDFGHGCSVSGVIAANIDNGIGIAGVAPNAQIMPLRVLNASGMGSYSDVAAAIVYAADHGAQVINLSLGGSSPSSALEQAVNYAVEKGVLLVAAAGNNGMEGALFPAAYPGVITVGSVDLDLQHSSFSNYGSQIDIWAPGRDILTTKRDGSYGLVSGTSFAAPYVTAAEALALSSMQTFVFTGQVLSLRNIAGVVPPTVSSTPTVTATPIGTPPSAPAIDFDTIVSVPEEIRQPILQEISLRSDESSMYSSYYASAFRLSSKEDWAEIVLVPSYVIESGWENLVFDDVIEVIAHQSSTGWVTYVDTDDNFVSISQDIPSDFIDFSAIYTLAEEYRFPWTAGQSWWKNGGWHTGYYGLDPNAVDFQPKSTLSTNLAVLAAGPGLLGSLCGPDSNGQMWLKITNADGTAGYGHLSESTVRKDLIGKSVVRGQFVGNLFSPGGSYDTPCGRGTATHLHFVFPTRNVSMHDNASNRDVPANEIGTNTPSGEVSYTSNNSRIDNPPSPSACKATTTSLPSGYAKCAEEGAGNYCSFSGTLTVYYGANSCFDIESKTNGVECTNNSFGGDPLEGVHKACYISGGISQGTWTAKYFRGHDHWWDTNNYASQMCQQPISGTNLDKNYGSSAPCGNEVNDHWVAEYTTNINFSSGNYVFQAQNDDGLKLWVNNTSILERGGSQSLAYICPARYLSGSIPIRAILNEEGGDASVKITWTTDTSVCSPPGSFYKSTPYNGISGTPTNPTLSWGSSSRANNYSYCIDTSNNNNCDTGWQGVGNVTSKVLSGLTTGTTYYWHVKAHSDGGETYSDGNTWWSFTVQTPRPGDFGKRAPSNGSTSQSTSPSLAWDPSSGASGYEYCIDTSNDNACSNWVSAGSNTSATISNLSSNTAYYWQVRASNAGGTTYANGSTTTFWSFTTEALPPAAPTLRVPGDGSSNPHNYDLTFQWNPSSGATEYQIEWWGGPYTTMQPCGWSNQTSCPIGVVAPGNTYSWHVRARNNYGTSAWSPTWTFTIQPAPLPDLVPFPRADAEIPVVVSYMTYWPYQESYVYSGQTAYYNWGYKNIGESNAGSHHIKVYLDSRQVLDYSFTGLNAGDLGGFDNWADNTYVTPGQHTVKIVVDANGEVNESNESNNTWTGTVTWRNPTVSIYEVYTTDDLGFDAVEDNPVTPDREVMPEAVKTTFSLGDPIRLYVGVLNEFSTDQTVTGEWQVLNPAGRLVPELSTISTITLGPGGWLWWQNMTIPQASLRGEYTFIGKITHNGITTTEFTTFTVVGPPTVEVRDVFVTPGEGSAASLETVPQFSVPTDVQSETIPNVNTGDPIRLYIDVINDVADGETAYFEWEVYDPWGRWIEELSWTGDLSTDLGESWWFLPTSIPSYVVTGDYAFTGYITYGDRTTHQTQIFHVNGAPGPSNDYFNSPVVIDNVPYTGTINTWGATTSTTDPTPTCGSGKNSNSVWYRYTPTSNGLLEVDTWGSNYDTVAAIWSGTSGNLYEIACNDDAYEELQAYLEAVPVTAGITYYIEIMDYGNPGGGNLDLYFNFAPFVSNDDFNNPVIITANQFNTSLNTGGATKATDDPVLTTCNRQAGQASVWYQYTPIQSGSLEIDTIGSNYDTMLAVWTGSRGSLNAVGCNDDIGDVNGNWDTDSILALPLNAGTSYYIGVSTFDGKIDANGATANELEKKQESVDSMIDTQALKNLVEEGEASVSVLLKRRGKEVSAQLWGGQLQLHFSYHHIPGGFNKLTPTQNATNQSANQEIRWGASSTADHYEYCYDTTNDNSCLDWMNNGSATSATLSGLAQFTPYYWQVRAVNSYGITFANASSTSFWSFTTGGVPGTFTKVSPTNGANNQLTNVTLSWGDSSNVTSYEFCYDTTNDNACSNWISNGTQKSKSLTGLSTETTYYWQVRSTNPFGITYPNGGEADFWSFTTFNQPPSPTFTDVHTTHPYYQDIEILYANGLTGGCGTNPLRFCPDQIMDRAQASVFMVRGAYGADYAPNPAKYLFKDSWSGVSYARPWAEAMRETNLTTGCKTSPLLYCPLTKLTREQAVIFGLKMKYGTYYQPPPATGTVFADMTNPGYYATAWVEKAYADGLITACGTLNGKPKFCPNVLVTRGLGAYIIVRAKSLTMP